MICSPMGSLDQLHHPHSLEGVKGDMDAASLNPHTKGPCVKSHTLDEPGNVGANKYDTYTRISYLVMHSDGDFIS